MVKARTVTPSDAETFHGLVAGLATQRGGDMTPADCVEVVAEFIVGRCDGHERFVGDLVDQWYQARLGESR